MDDASDGQAHGADAQTQDWTRGPAKRLAVAVLGAASLLGMTLTLWTGTPRPPPIEPGGGPSLAGPNPSPTSPRAGTGVARRLVNINTAARAELELLPGIGPTLAERIIKDRSTKGPYRTSSDLARVKGVGQKTLQKLRPLITIGDPPVPATAPPATAPRATDAPPGAP